MSTPAVPDMPVAVPPAAEPVPGYAAQIAALEDRVLSLETKLGVTPLEQEVTHDVFEVAESVAAGPLGLAHGLIVPLVLVVLTVIATVVCGITGVISGHDAAEYSFGLVSVYLGAHGLANINDSASAKTTTSISKKA